MGIQAINHVQLAYPVGATAQVRAFYSDVLQLPEIAQERGCLRFAAGGQCIDLVPAQGPASWGPAAHLALAVRELSHFEGRLAQAHWVSVPGHTAAGQPRLYVKDPAGNVLELLEVGTHGGSAAHAQAHATN